MEVPLLDLKAQYERIKPEVDAAIQRVVDSQYFILGPEVKAFEREIAAYCGCEFAVGVSSGTDALLVALMAIDVGPGDEVVTTPYTFFATAGCIARLGATPVFVDIDPITYNIDASAIEDAITERTKAIIPVHLYGQVAEMDPIIEVADRYELYVIEDAAQAIGAEYKGRKAGTIGHLGCFSFFPSKNLGGYGDGGMVVTNAPELADRVTLLRNHGHRPKYYNKLVGGNFRLDAIQAALLRVKLKYLDQWTEERRRNATTYRTLLTERGVAEQYTDTIEVLNTKEYVVLPQEAGQRRHIYNQFVIRVDRRDALKRYLKDRKIGCAVYYPLPLHLQDCFTDLGYQVGDLPVSERASVETLALPIYPELTRGMQSTIANVIVNFWRDA